MASLDRNLRKDLENAVKKARRVADAGARQVLEQLAVNHHEPWGALTPEQRKLRNRLRAHGRQLGDQLDEKGTQSIDRLAAECAYEHWHRLLFARFLAENNLLVEPGSGMALSLDECRELARERSVDWLVLASDFAQRMLPQIFRAGDPVLEVTLPPEKRQELEEILEALPRDVFIAYDSLGWVYQFWQAEQKDAVNKSENKIGADELPSVTQLFTEDYMVLFLLHNTLGAWWAGKVLGQQPELARKATSEGQLRKACALPGVDWAYLRFVRVGEMWRPAASPLDGWPKTAKDITVLDPCMGSGHFLVSALAILAAIRAAEEKLSRDESAAAVLRDNLFGLEIDPRCTQIAAFNLALAVWRNAGYRALPTLHIACSGLSLSARKDDWLRLAGDDVRRRNGMERLYALFEQAPLLGSLINPRAGGGTLLDASYRELEPIFEKAVGIESGDDAARELAVAALGIARAAQILATQFTVIVTNVPYLGLRKQARALTAYCAHAHASGRHDLATAFLDRIMHTESWGRTVAAVTPLSWLSIGSYKTLREGLLRRMKWSLLAPLGTGAFESLSGEVVNVGLIVLQDQSVEERHTFLAVDAGSADSTAAKAALLREDELIETCQHDQFKNPDSRVVLGTALGERLLGGYAHSLAGIQNGDSPRFQRALWEVTEFRARWVFEQSAVDATAVYGAMDTVIDYDLAEGHLRAPASWRRESLHDSDQRGKSFWGKRGVLVRQMGKLPCCLYLGDLYDQASIAIVPDNPTMLPALWVYCSSPELNNEVRRLDRKVNVTSATLVKVPFDLSRWERIATEEYPRGLPEPHSSDPTQWIFDGHPRGSTSPLHVAVARLLGHCWPRQLGCGFTDSPAISADGLEGHADEDGVVCLMPLKGERAAADRVRELLADATASEWSATTLRQLLEGAKFEGKSLEEWLRDAFFEQHCDIFHQRPFVWQVWDGLNNGFSALVNYHKLAAPNGEGRRTLEKLIYTYLGDWIDRQRADQKAGIEGADARVAAAEHLKRELEKILEGEPPYDIFVRWKPLHEQPVGWEPDINDGVRINIRPFMLARPLNAGGKKQAKNTCILRVPPKITWDKDRGKEPSRSKADYPWFWGWDEKTPDFLGGPVFDANRWNDLHYSRAVKLAARERAKGA